MKFKLTQVIPAAALVCLLLASCKKNDAVSSSPQIPSELRNTANLVDLGMDEIIADFEEDDAITSASETSNAVTSGNVSNGSTDECPVITYSPSKDVFPHTKTYDYGAGCTIQGKTISGKKIVKVYASTKTATAGTRVRGVSFSNYYVNGISISGNVVVNVDQAATPGPLKTRAVTNKTLADNQGHTSTFIGTYVRTEISSTEAKVTGSSYGVEIADGQEISLWNSSVDASNPVIKLKDCSYRPQGGINIKVRTLLPKPSNDNEYLDYGNGTCDNEATLSINGGPATPVTLPIVFYAAQL